VSERSTGRVAGAMGLGLLLGIVGGWVAGLLRVPPPAPSTTPGTGR
jgi:hypothetical protein